jgi:pimeloyl-ACP methyl ester carboxylesterase
VHLDANGFRFDALTAGPQDGPVVLLLHGFPQTASSWQAVMERLAARGLRCVAEDYRLPALVSDAQAFIAALGGRVHLVGHDWGGVVGWQVAARHPSLVASWTAVSTAYGLALRDVFTDPAQRERFAYMRQLRQPDSERWLLDSGAANFRDLFGGRVSSRRLEEDLRLLAEPGALTAATNWYRAMDRSDSDGLGPVTVPTTYVWGAGDVAFSREAAERTGHYVEADYRFVPLEDASHWLPDEVPDLLADEIAARAGA